MGLVSAIKSLLGISAYQRPAEIGESLDSARIESLRDVMGGQLAPLPTTQTRWLLADLEQAQIEADVGVLSRPARLWNAAQRDGVLAGVLSTRTGGLVRLPRRFRGSAEMIRELELGHDSVRSVFDEMLPPAELAKLAGDGIGLGVGVGELMPVEGRDYPVLVTLPPEHLVYWWSRNLWLYRSIGGLLPITPGDGRWVLHIPGGRIAPWQYGVWRAVGRAFINKEHALLHDANWQAKLANPARVAVSPSGATDEESQTWFQQVMAWGKNTVFGMRPGYDVKLLESNGRGSDAFDRTVTRSEREMIIAVAGQVVTTDGGAGFQNSDIHRSIRADLIEATAGALSYTLNTQAIPPWVLARWGEARLAESPCVEWDVAPPRDRVQEGTALLTAAQAISQLAEALKATGAGARIDVPEIAIRFGIPILGDSDGDGAPDEDQDPEVVIDVEGEEVPDPEPEPTETDET